MMMPAAVRWAGGITDLTASYVGRLRSRFILRIESWNAMSGIDASTRLERGERSDDSTLGRRSQSPSAIKIIMPVWGVRFISQFLEFTLPSLLAPGNVPTLAKALPCQFTVLTSGKNIHLFREHHAWRRLEQICSAEIEIIDDLITDRNHSTTLTLSYVRAIRQSGAQTLDTCFILLVSDYIMADGSLGHVLARMQSGASGVLAGNFQIIAEEAIPLLRRKLALTATEIALPPRDLVRWACNHLHPATTASIVNYPLCHKAHTNRLFWRVNDGTLIGRFYLLHPIAVRPEVADFVVSSSFDYSFIPEMCPSKNVVAITDSDNYLVVEIQPRDHEAKQVRLGPIEPANLAKSLSEWTTAEHRSNIQHTFVYHTSDLPAELSNVAHQADQFVDEVGRNLTPAAQPHRNHHYWIGAIAVHRAQTGQTLTAEDKQFFLSAASQGSRLSRLLFRGRTAFFGTPPDVQPWHPRWPDYRPILEALRRTISPNSELLIVTHNLMDFAPWLASCPYKGTTLEIGRLLHLSRRQYMPLVGKFDCCLVLLREADLKLSDQLLKRIGPLLNIRGHALISTSNDQSIDPRNFTESYTYHVGRLINLNLSLKEIHYVPSSRLRGYLQRVMARLARDADSRAVYVFPFFIFAVGATTILSYLLNLLSARTFSEPKDKACSSVLMVLNSSVSGSAMPLPEFDDSAA
jgi:hypothetical protein